MAADGAQRHAGDARQVATGDPQHALGERLADQDVAVPASTGARTGAQARARRGSTLAGDAGVEPATVWMIPFVSTMRRRSPAVLRLAAHVVQESGFREVDVARGIHLQAVWRDDLRGGRGTAVARMPGPPVPATMLVAPPGAILTTVSEQRFTMNTLPAASPAMPTGKPSGCRAP